MYGKGYCLQYTRPCTTSIDPLWVMGARYSIPQIHGSEVSPRSHGSRSLGIYGSGGSMDVPSCTSCYTGYALPAYNVRPMAVGHVLRVYCSIVLCCSPGPHRVHRSITHNRDSRPRIHGSQGLGSCSTHPVDESLYLSSRHSSCG